eukprot:364631-Chlamydomonas_euryale.AAC.33
MHTRNFKQASSLFLEALATFTATELFPYRCVRTLAGRLGGMQRQRLKGGKKEEGSAIEVVSPAQEACVRHPWVVCDIRGWPRLPARA